MPPPVGDVEGAIVDALRTRAGILAHPHLRAPYPAVAVIRVGGDRAVVADTALVQVDAAGPAGGSKSATLALLEQVVGAVRDLSGSTYAGVSFASVRVTGGPLYQPDPATGAPRYLATLSVVSRAARTAGV